jgi:hypothetical protein
MDAVKSLINAATNSWVPMTATCALFATALLYIRLKKNSAETVASWNIDPKHGYHRSFS